MVETIHYYNMDCVAAMKEFSDNFFDLAIVDPPYGAGFAESGGCQGWFAKYHKDGSQSVQVERERADRTTGSGNGSTDTRKFVRFNNSGRQARYAAKKISRGTLPQRTTISKSCFAFHATRLFGAEITFTCLRLGALSYGEK